MAETIEVLVDGGQASAGPPLGPALGPLGVNIMEIVNSINQKTKNFKGMKVPVKVIVDTSTKVYDIKVGTPPTSALVKNELGLKRGSGEARTQRVGDLSMDQAIKIAEMKEDSLLGKTMKEKVKEVAGTCYSMGVTLEGEPAKRAQRRIEDGEFDDRLQAESP
ncbi:MAG: 50S ribosomal protein L11 [Methanomassiliicoccales archaeon]